MKLATGTLKVTPNFRPSRRQRIPILTPRGENEAGFTLIELLIVIVIISIISSVAIISIHFNQSKNLETFSYHLRNLFNLAEEEAMLRPATIGFALTKEDYQFYEYDETKKTWSVFSDPRLGSHKIANKMQLILKMNDKTIEANGKPQIIISPSGDITPFTLLIGEPDSQAQYQVSAKANGEVQSESLSKE